MMSSIGKEFMEKTKFQYLERSDQSRYLPQPPLDMLYKIFYNQFHKISKATAN